MTNFLIAAIAVSSVVALNVSSGAAQGNRKAVNDDIGAEITLQGCVVAGEGSGTFVFTRIKEWPVRASPVGLYGPRHYWLGEDAADFTDHIGETIQITGTVIEVKESEVEREPGLTGGKSGGRVAIELPGRDVITTPGNAGVPLRDGASKVDMKITLVKLRIEKMLVVLKGCLAQ